MMKWIVATSLRIRVAVVAVTLLLVLAGTRILSTTAFDVFPEFAPPLVEIQTEAPGLSTRRSRRSSRCLSRTPSTARPGSKTVRSKSVLGLSSVVLTSPEGTSS